MSTVFLPKRCDIQSNPGSRVDFKRIVFEEKASTGFNQIIFEACAELVGGEWPPNNSPTFGMEKYEPDQPPVVTGKSWAHRLLGRREPGPQGGGAQEHASVFDCPLYNEH